MRCLSNRSSVYNMNKGTKKRRFYSVAHGTLYEIDLCFATIKKEIYTCKKPKDLSCFAFLWSKTNFMACEIWVLLKCRFVSEYWPITGSKKILKAISNLWLLKCGWRSKTAVIIIQLKWYRALHCVIQLSNSRFSISIPSSDQELVSCWMLLIVWSVRLLQGFSISITNPL